MNPGHASWAALSSRLDSQRAFADLKGLAAFGPRVAGSPEEDAASTWLMDRFAAAGVPATRQPFPIRRWTERSARLAVGPLGEIPMTAVPFGGTTGADREFDLVVVDGFDLGEIPDGDLAGKAWLMPRDAYRDYPDRALVEALGPRAPGALIFTAAPGHRGGVPTVFYNFRDAIDAPAPPMAVIAYDSAMALIRDRVPRVRLTIDADDVPGTSANIIASLRGRSRPDEIVVVCAHVDSAPTSPGACDNAGGTACVLELARAAAASGGPDRTVHFAIWGSHETGMHGSETYLARAMHDGLRLHAAINFDTIGLLVAEDRVNLLGGPRWEALVRAAIPKSGLRPPFVPGPGYTDFTNFGAAGVPSISFGQGLGAWAHTPGDRVEHCGPSGLTRPLRMSARALAAAADGPDLGGDFPASLRDEVRRFNGRWGWSNFAAAG